MVLLKYFITVLAVGMVVSVFLRLSKVPLLIMRFLGTISTISTTAPQLPYASHHGLVVLSHLLVDTAVTNVHVDGLV